MFKFNEIKKYIELEPAIVFKDTLVKPKVKEKFRVYKSKTNKISIIDKIINSNNFVQYKSLQKYYGSYWSKKIQLINLIVSRTKPIKRYRLFYINFAIYIYFFENTIPLKNIFFRAIKYRPLKKHKKYTKNILIVIRHCVGILQSQNISTKLQIVFKGKLGLRGDNKKKKNIYVMSTRIKYVGNKTHYYDGIGSSSGYGHTFMRIRYGSTTIKCFYFLKKKL